MQMSRCQFYKEILIDIYLNRNVRNISNKFLKEYPAGLTKIIFNTLKIWLESVYIRKSS